MSDQRFASPLYAHESFSHVSLPTSPGCGIGLKVHRGLPVRTSKACTIPGGAAILLGRSDIDPPRPTPTMTTSLQTCGTPVQTQVEARGPRPGRRFTRPFSPNVVTGRPVFRSSAIRYSPRITKRRL